MTIRPHSTRVSSSSEPPPATWFQQWRQHGYFFRPVAIFTILLGACLHIGRLLLGDQITFRYLVTPVFDQLFAIPIVYAGLTGLLSWPRMVFRNRWHKAFLGFIIFYMVISIPIHVATYFTHSIDHVRWFPRWFSVLLQPFYAAVLVALWRLQFKPDPKE